MRELQIVVVRHGEREKSDPDGESKLTSHGTEEVRSLGKQLKSLGVVLQHCFASEYRHAQETAEALAREAGDPGSQLPVVAVPTLTPAGPEERERALRQLWRAFRRHLTPRDTEEPSAPEEWFPIEDIVQHARHNRIELNVGDTVALVGHEGRLSNLISRMTGKRFRPLGHAEAICLAGGGLEDFRCGGAKVLWRIPVKAYEEAELRKKVASKLTVATLLAGFSFAALVQLATGNLAPLTPIEKILGNDLLSTAMFTAALSWLAVICLTAASALFIATAYIYDSLSMPEGFWVASGSAGSRRPPAFVRKHKDEYDEYGPVHFHMVRTWTYVFTPGVIMAAVGFLLLIIHAASKELGILCAIAIIVTGVYYWRVRPKLGVD